VGRQTRRPISTNVVIVGAGVNGLKTALKLSREQGQSFYGSETKRKQAYVNDIDEDKRKRISIVSTTGPKENTQETINKLRKVGQNVVLMNFSHPPYEPHKSLIGSVRENGGSKDCRRVPYPSVPQRRRKHLRRAHFKPMSKTAGTKNNRKADGRSDWSQETETEYYWMGNNRGQVSSNTITNEQDESIENFATSRESRYGTPRAPIPRSLDRKNGEVSLDNG
jgi:hypothetical protein